MIIKIKNGALYLILQRLKQLIPKVKIVLVVRNPIIRIVSQLLILNGDNLIKFVFKKSQYN